MNVGFGQAEINPPLGMPMVGTRVMDGIQSIHDDLFARALWLEQDGRNVVIVSLDLLFFDRALTDRMRGAVARLFNLKINEILLNFSHNHAGPHCSEWRYLDQPRPDPIYLSKVERGIITAVDRAQRSLEPGDCQAGATTTNLPVSRRKVDAQGLAQWAPSPSSEVCRHLPFALFRNKRGKVQALLFSVSCHPSMMYLCDVTAEFPGAAARQLNDYFHTNGSIFLQGAGGDTKPRQVAGESQWLETATWEDMEAAGKEVAVAVIKASEGKLRHITPDIQVVSLETFWPLQAPPPRQEFAAVTANPEEHKERQAWAHDMLAQLDLFGKLPEAAPMTLHGVRIGKGLCLIALECELVGELGNLIRAERRTGLTFPLGYTNGCALYLPSNRQLPQHGYEVDCYWEYHWPAPLAGGIDERLRNYLRDLEREGIA